MSLKVVYQDGGPEPGGDVPTARIPERIVAPSGLRPGRPGLPLGSAAGSVGGDAETGGAGDRAGDTGAVHVAVAARILVQVLLVVVLRVVEGGQRRDLGGDRTVTGSGERGAVLSRLPAARVACSSVVV